MNTTGSRKELNLTIELCLTETKCHIYIMKTTDIMQLIWLHERTQTVHRRSNNKLFTSTLCFLPKRGHTLIAWVGGVYRCTLHAHCMLGSTSPMGASWTAAPTHQCVLVSPGEMPPSSSSGMVCSLIRWATDLWYTLSFTWTLDKVYQDERGHLHYGGHPSLCRLAKRIWGDGASCTKTCMDFLLRHGVRSNPNALPRIKIFGCMNLCIRMNPSTFPSSIPINVELSVHVGVTDSSLSTPQLKYANNF